MGRGGGNVVDSGGHTEAHTPACSHIWRYSGTQTICVHVSTEEWRASQLDWGVNIRKWTRSYGFKVQRTWNGRSTAGVAALELPSVGGWRYVYFLFTTWILKKGGSTKADKNTGEHGPSLPRICALHCPQMLPHLVSLSLAAISCVKL